MQKNLNMICVADPKLILSLQHEFSCGAAGIRWFMFTLQNDQLAEIYGVPI